MLVLPGPKLSTAYSLFFLNILTAWLLYNVLARMPKILKICLWAALAGAGFYCYPRWLVVTFGESHYLSPYLYLYGLGGPIFIFTMALMIHFKALNFKIPGEKKWAVIFVSGLFGSWLIHTVWIAAAVLAPFYGGF